MIQVKVKDSEVKALLKHMRKKGGNMTPLMALFYGKVHQEVLKNFRMQGATADILSGKAPSDNRRSWKPLTAYTVACRGNAGGILQDTGYMMGTMGKVREIGAFSLTYGTTSSISHVHHFGATIKPKKGKYLALPFPGVKGRPRDYDDTYFRGRVIMQNDYGGEAQPLFFLKEKVTIPARPHLTISKSALESMEELTVKFLTGELNI